MSPWLDPNLRIGIVGATGAVGRTTLLLLLERGYSNIRTFASWRSAGEKMGDFEIEEATPVALGAGELDLCFFSIGENASRTLVPAAVAGGALCIDKSAAFRLDEDVPLIVPEVNGEEALYHRGVIANPNCCAIPLSIVLAALRDAAGLRRVHVATYQSVSGAGTEAMESFATESPHEHSLRMDWELTGSEFDEEAKLRDETRKILGLPDLPISATCVRVPVMVGHAEAVWVETEEPIRPDHAGHALAVATGIRLEDIPRPVSAIGADEVIVGRVREDPTVENGLALFIICDNLRKGAALNAVQIADLLLQESVPALRFERSFRR